MIQNKRKSIQHYIRSFHRDIGFFVIGMTIIYSVSGVVLIYRTSDFVKIENHITRVVSRNINEEELADSLKIREFKLLHTVGDVVYFENGTYNKATGEAKYTQKVFPSFVKTLNDFHVASSNKISHWFSVVFGVCLLFLALSSFWMFKPNSKYLQRGIIFASVGFVFAILLLIFGMNAPEKSEEVKAVPKEVKNIAPKVEQQLTEVKGSTARVTIILTKDAATGIGAKAEETSKPKVASKAETTVKKDGKVPQKAKTEKCDGDCDNCILEECIGED